MVTKATAWSACNGAQHCVSGQSRSSSLSLRVHIYDASPSITIADAITPTIESNGNLELCGCDNVRATSWVKALGKVAFVEVARTPNKLCELRRFLSSVSIHGITYHPVAFNINVPGHHFAVARIGELWVSLDSYMHKVSSASPISPTVLATKHHAQITTILYARDGPLLRQESINLNEPAAPAVGVTGTRRSARTAQRTTTNEYEYRCIADDNKSV